MTFAPNITELLARALADLRMGVPIVLTGNRESALIFAAETIAADRFDTLRGHIGGCDIAITSRRAQTLNTPAYDGDLVRIIMPHAADIGWLQALADPKNDLAMPMKGPFETRREGSSALHRMGITMAKSARLLPAVIVAPIKDPAFFVRDANLTQIFAAQAAPILATTSDLAPVVSARLPLQVSEAGRLHIFRPEDGGEEHYAMEIGAPDRNEPVLARLHSACFTGDVLGSMKCDCGPQLNAALAQMGAAGHGVLLYLNQEGRGIGLANKMRAYSLQDQGFDTVEANHRLGFEDDERDFRLGAHILRKMGFSSVRLMTNNPKKIKMMKDAGLDVAEHVPLKVGENPLNAAYLATKAAKSGHML